MIPAIILAAGQSTRMGRSKALLPIGNADAFVTMLVRTFHAAGIDDLVVVVGAQAEQVRQRLQSLPLLARSVENADYERGQLSSLQVGLDVVDRPGVRAVMAMPVDMPLVRADTVRAIRDTFLRTGAAIVRPAHEGRHGHPVLFDRALFDELRQADVSIGARAVVAGHAEQTVDVDVDDRGAFVDIDTPEDYERFVGAPFPR